MVEIEFSMIPDAEEDVFTMTSMLGDFEKLTGVKVRLRTMQWSTAWTDLLTIASRGAGPDVSHIGGTWVSSLAAMNALRSFRLVEVQEMGGARAFLSPAWQSVFLSGDDHIWAIPWTGYAYMICYRRDLLLQCGITDFQEAFRDHKAVVATVQRLSQSRLPIPWLIGRYPPPYSDLVHIAASWIWSAGGDFVSPDGKQLALDQDEAMAGLANMIAIFRAVPKRYMKLSPAEAVAVFAEARAAAVLTNNRAIESVIMSSKEPEVRENLGLVNLTETPWCSGGNFILWKHTMNLPEREQAAVALVKYLTSRDAEVRWGRAIHSLMARRDAAELLYPEKHPFHHPVRQLAEHGRAYPTIPLWHRMEYQIGKTLSAILEEAQQFPRLAAEDILHRHLPPLTDRLNRILQG